MTQAGWWVRFERELAQAAIARTAGNEGKARVCARRAAGEAIREYWIKVGQVPQGSTYELIEALRHHPGLTTRATQILEHLLQRVEPGGAFPGQVDLIAEVQELIFELGLDEPPGP
jgi:hypothetical protein